MQVHTWEPHVCYWCTTPGVLIERRSLMPSATWSRSSMERRLRIYELTDSWTHANRQSALPYSGTLSVGRTKACATRAVKLKAVAKILAWCSSVFVLMLHRISPLPECTKVADCSCFQIETSTARLKPVLPGTRFLEVPCPVRPVHLESNWSDAA